MFSIKRIVTHRCELEEKTSNSCLPLLPPQVGFGPKFKRWFKKCFQVSHHHHQTKKYFRSTAMLHQERRRHLRESSWYILHPFSVLQLIVEAVMTVVWMVTLFTDIFRISFYTFESRTETYLSRHVYIVDLLQMCFVILSFLTGYLDVMTHEVVLEKHQISMHYVSTYFIFDFIGLLPLSLFVNPALPFNRPPSITITVSFLKCVRLARIKTTLLYLRTITIWLKISDTVHKIITMALILLILLHWSACILFMLPRVEHFYNNEWAETAWVVQAGITDSRKVWQYFISLHTAMCYFFSAGTSMYTIIDTKDQLMCSLITITGYGYLMYMLAQILQMVSSTTASESKYEELVHMLNEFSIKKKMPETLRLRLMLYYENRFQKRYFRESAILSTLSEHLRYEILLHSCKHLFEKLTIFQGLSRVVLGTIIACLKQEVYLPNDVIMKADGPADCMYLVGYGTLALYTIDGLEIMHIEDGDHFGETGLLRPDSEKSLNIVAVETSEIFRLDKQDFFHVVNTYDDFAQRIQKAVAQRLEMVSKLQDHLTRLHGKHDIVNDLKQGKILEKSYKRHK